MLINIHMQSIVSLCLARYVYTSRGRAGYVLSIGQNSTYDFLRPKIRHSGADFAWDPTIVVPLKPPPASIVLGH